MLFIDTCALADRSFAKWLAGYSGVKKISVITYMEYLTRLIDQGYDESFLNKLLKQMKVDVEYFRTEDAANAAHLMASHPAGGRRCSQCNQVNWNDTIISSQSNRFQAWIVTKNIGDFPTDPKYKVTSVDYAMNELSRYSVS